MWSNVFAREFVKALVLVKPLPDGSCSFDTAYTYPFTGKLLNADGTLSETIDQLNLRNGEAAILTGAKKRPEKPGKPNLFIQ